MRHLLLVCPFQDEGSHFLQLFFSFCCHFVPQGFFFFFFFFARFTWPLLRVQSVDTSQACLWPNPCNNRYWKLETHQEFDIQGERPLSSRPWEPLSRSQRKYKYTTAEGQCGRVTWPCSNNNKHAVLGDRNTPTMHAFYLHCINGDRDLVDGVLMCKQAKALSGLNHCLAGHSNSCVTDVVSCFPDSTSRVLPERRRDCLYLGAGNRGVLRRMVGVRTER